MTMKNKSFTLGAIAGITSFAIAVPILAQVSSAASASSAATGDVPPQQEMRMMKQPDLQTMIDHDTTLLANVDSMVATLKSATQAHLNALNAAKSVTDAAAQKEAIKKANDDMRAAMKAAMDAHPEWKGAMPFLGGHDGPPMMGGRMGMMGRGPGPERLAEKLGMTADELKAALDSGKTVEDIAAEKGITLPARPAFKMMKARGASSSAQ